MEDLQSLLEKINREGIEKANAEAERILAEAKAKAEGLVKAAREEAARAKADAEKSAEEYASRADETVRQASRDAVLRVEAAVGTLLEKVLAKDVDRALADEKTVGSLVLEAIKGLTGPVEVAVPTKLVEALKAQLAAQSNVTVVLDQTHGTGFAVKLDGGRVEHAFTGEVVAGELARRLRPDLAKLMR